MTHWDLTFGRQGAAAFASWLLIGMCVALGGNAPAAEAQERTDHSTWDRIVRTYVDAEGKVAYERIAREARQDLDGYLAEIAAADPAAMRPPEQVAFWINAYNAGVVAGVLDGYSPESTLGRARFFRWYTFEVAGQRRTLDSIEHEILRKQFSEPRIHFALVCAATSCPKLRQEAYVEARLDEQLDDQGRRFVNDLKRNEIDAVAGKIRLSRIFEWFAADFTKASGAVASFVAQYVADPRQAAALRQHTAALQYLDYDWTLNAAPGERAN